ncbi:MAG: type III-A CRISPR-associated protein Csm2 [Thermus sp.]
MIVFYEDREKGILKKGLFDQEAKRQAEAIRGELKSSQFRNYFAELRALEARFQRERLQEEALAFRRLVPQLELLKAKLHYNTRPQGPLKDARNFVDFMERLIDTAKGGPKEFEAAMLYLEAVLAYFYALERREGR